MCGGAAGDRVVRLPDFLIIGAQKAATTSLYFDLLQNPAVFMTSDKEPGNLIEDDVCTKRGRAAYANLFKRARQEQVCGEASTGYTKLPDYAGVVDRARRVLGDSLKVVYIVREPISRIRSHHHHERSGRRISCDIDKAVRRYSRFVDYSRYAMQITPWIEAFGRDQVFVMQFESYIADRPTTVDAVSRFLGIDPAGDQVETDVVYNASSGKPILKGPLQLVRPNVLYRTLIRPMLSARARQSLRRLTLPKATQRAETPSAETVRYIVSELAGDVRKLSEIMGKDELVWNFDDTRETTSSTSPAPPRGHEG